MSNGTIDDAQVEAILSGGQPSVNRYVVETLQVVVACVEATPAAIENAIDDHKKKCRGQSKRAVCGFFTALGACIALATPYVLQLFR